MALQVSANAAKPLISVFMMNLPLAVRKPACLPADGGIDTLKHQCINPHLRANARSKEMKADGTSMVMLDRSRQVAVQVYEILKERIASVTLTPGTVLSRLELQDEFGVSQTPVRDALLRLQEEGLVDIFPQHATLVSRIDIAHARQAQFLRLSIELEAVRRLASEAATETAAALADVITQQEEVADPHTHDRFDALDRAFHQLLYLRTGNLNLWRVMRTQSTHLDRLRRLNLPMPGKMQAVLRDHRAIVDAVRSGNAGQTAEEAMRKHLSGTLAMVDAIRVQYPEYIQGEGKPVIERRKIAV